MYCVIKIQVGPENGFYEYFYEMTKAANNLYNATLFRVRQVLTFTQKPESEWTDNEKAVHDEIAKYLPAMKSKYKMPEKGKASLSYSFLEDLMKVSSDPDYRDKRLPVQAAQNVIKTVTRSMNGFWGSLKAFYENPKCFTGKPKIPNYHRKGGNTTVIISNQDCVVYPKENRIGHEVKFPKIKERLDLGDAPIRGRLKQVTVTPSHGIFVVAFVFENEDKSPKSLEPSNVCSIDLGVSNIAAITNNLGETCLLFKGGVVKSANQWYNKKMAQIQSEKTIGTTNKFVMTPEAHKLCVKRENQMSDFMHKVAKQIITWCQEHNIGTIVIGVNKMQKQRIDMKKKNNQEYVEIPFTKLRQYIGYLAERSGINVVEREESYTSQASFSDMDYIPTYGVDDAKANFSGKRMNRLYKDSEGNMINSDLNGSANIMRKERPDVFNERPKPDFNKVQVIWHPDYDRMVANRKKQLAEPRATSKSKLRRLQKKAAKCNPSGIGLCE